MVHPVIPMAIMVIGGILAALSLRFVPETRNKDLPNTLQDAIEVWGRKHKDSMETIISR